MTAEFILEPEQQIAPLDITVTHDDDPRVQRIAVSGEVDALTGTQLHQAVIDVLRRHRPGHIEMDVRGVQFLDSAGIRILLMCHTDAAVMDCRLRLAACHPVVSRVLHVTGLADHFGLSSGPPPGR